MRWRGLKACSASLTLLWGSRHALVPAWSAVIRYSWTSTDSNIPTHGKRNPLCAVSAFRAVDLVFYVFTSPDHHTPGLFRGNQKELIMTTQNSSLIVPVLASLWVAGAAPAIAVPHFSAFSASEASAPSISV